MWRRYGWTEYENSLLRCMAEMGCTVKETAETLGRPMGTVAVHAWQHGILFNNGKRGPRPKEQAAA